MTSRGCGVIIQVQKTEFPARSLCGTDGKGGERMRAKGTKSAVIAAALSVVLCVGMLAGTTFAWFTDTVTSAGNIIAAGSLDAGLVYAEGWNGEDTAWQDAS